jgi:large subunit ribosomal protein L32
MPPLPKKKHSRGRTGKKRAHQALKAVSVSECSNCHKVKLPHRVCPTCGYYDGREVVPQEAAGVE